jgi:hypothetical protein
MQPPHCPEPTATTSPHARGQVALGPVDLDNGPDLKALTRYSRLTRLELRQWGRGDDEIIRAVSPVASASGGFDVDINGALTPAVASRRLRAVLDGFVRPPPPPG